MADFAGDQKYSTRSSDYGHPCWRAYANWSSSENDTSMTISLDGYMQATGYGFQLTGGVTVTVDVGGTSNSGTVNLYTNYAAWGLSTPKVSTSKTITKTHTAQSIKLTVTVLNATGFQNGSSTGSTTVTVPAKKSYAVKYNANGGSGVPANQTKWYGENLTLSSTKPTRTGYDFVGWATSSTATSANANYAPGKTYSSNAALTLYAVWKVSYIGPSITGLKAIRVASNTATTENQSGAYCYITCQWSVDTTQTSGNLGKALSIQYRVAGTSNWSNATVSGWTANKATSGTAYGRFSAATGNAYEIQATITDTPGGKAVKIVGLGSINIPFEIGNNGKNIGIRHSASATNATIVGSRIDSISSMLTVNSTPSSNVYDSNCGLSMLDLTGYALCYVRPLYYTNGAYGMQHEVQRVVDGTRKTNTFNMFITEDGTPTVAITTAAKPSWRSQLGLAVNKSTSTSLITAASGITITSLDFAYNDIMVMFHAYFKCNKAYSAYADLTIGTINASYKPACIANGVHGWILANGQIHFNVLWDVAANTQHAYRIFYLRA